MCHVFREEQRHIEEVEDAIAVAIRQAESLRLTDRCDDRDLDRAALVKSLVVHGHQEADLLARLRSADRDRADGLGSVGEDR